MKHIKETLVLWILMGMIYLTMEAVWRGWTHISMLAVGGLCGIAVGGLNQLPPFYKLPVWVQSLIGTVITLAIEFVSGCILNIGLGLDIWDYSGKFGNVLGQICLPFALIWFSLMPFAIWLEDTLRWRLWKEGESYTLGSIYIELLEGK